MLFSALVLTFVQDVDVWDLRERVEVAGADGWESGEVLALSGEILDSARRASSRGSFLGAMGLVGELCLEATPAEARELRTRALELLARRDSDTLRWSTLVLSAFVPDFVDLPRSAWAEELAVYDRLLDELVASGVTPRAQAELISAKVFARVQIDRRWDWLEEARRRAVLEELASLRERFGEERCPGTSGAASETIGERAARFEYALTRLAFGAVAPPTRGEDLGGEPLDLVDFRGRLVVLDFWTTFCQPCLELVPTARELLDELEGEPIEYVGVCGDTDREMGRATAERVGMTWRNLWDGPRGTEGPAATAWQVEAVGWPTVVVLDGRGRIRAKMYGKDEVERRLEEVLSRLLAEEKGTTGGSGER